MSHEYDLLPPNELTVRYPDRPAHGFTPIPGMNGPFVKVEGLGVAKMHYSFGEYGNYDDSLGIAILNGEVIRKPAQDFIAENASHVMLDFFGHPLRAPFRLLTIARHPKAALIAHFDVELDPDPEPGKPTTGGSSKWLYEEFPDEYVWFSYAPHTELGDFRFSFEYLGNPKV